MTNIVKNAAKEGDKVSQNIQEYISMRKNLNGKKLIRKNIDMLLNCVYLIS